MFVSLVKIKKYLIYFFLFLFFNCFFSVSIKAAETTFVRSKAVNGNNVQWIRGLTFNADGDKMFVAGDYLNINSSYSRVQGNRSERRDTIDFAVYFTSNRETKYTISLVGDEDIKTKLGISKNIHGFDLGFNANQTFNKKPNQEAELMLSYNF